MRKKRSSQSNPVSESYNAIILSLVEITNRGGRERRKKKEGGKRGKKGKEILGNPVPFLFTQFFYLFISFVWLPIWGKGGKEKGRGKRRAPHIKSDLRTKGKRRVRFFLSRKRGGGKKRKGKKGGKGGPPDEAASDVRGSGGDCFFVGAVTLSPGLPKKGGGGGGEGEGGEKKKEKKRRASSFLSPPLPSRSPHPPLKGKGRRGRK